MAKALEGYRSYIIKATTPRDNTTFSHWICTRQDPTVPEMEASSIEEARMWIDGTRDAEIYAAAKKKAAASKRKSAAATKNNAPLSSKAAEAKLNKYCDRKGYSESCEFYPNESTATDMIYHLGDKGGAWYIECNYASGKITERKSNTEDFKRYLEREANEGGGKHGKNKN